MANVRFKLRLLKIENGQKQLKTILMDKKLRETTNLCTLLPSDVTDFAVLPAQRLLVGNKFLSYVM